MDMRVGLFEIPVSALTEIFCLFSRSTSREFYTTLKMEEIHFLGIQNDVISKFLTSKLSKNFQKFSPSKLFLHVFVFSPITNVFSTPKHLFYRACYNTDPFFGHVGLHNLEISDLKNLKKQKSFKTFLAENCCQLVFTFFRAFTD